jgi:hypothetical protein
VEKLSSRLAEKRQRKKERGGGEKHCTNKPDTIKLIYINSDLNIIITDTKWMYSKGHRM